MKLKNSGIAVAIAGSMLFTVPAFAQEVIVNGGFEADASETYNPQGWQVQENGIFGSVIATDAHQSSASGYNTVGAASGNYYGLLDSAYPSSQVLYQNFSIGAVTSAVLSFQMFVNDQSDNGIVYINQAGLDATTNGTYAPNQHVRVDLLLASADPFSVNATDIIGTYYLGGANGRRFDGADNSNNYVDYSFDLTSLLASGGNYTLRFASVSNQGALQVGLDNVSLNVTPVPEADTYAMFLAGLGLLGLVLRRRNTI
ncbi:PEP-CTERM sorting domain-containing protein [Methylobacillus caricis]|uniref:PEP-CTERM sorting domain-containing protein n=1 Tax=Methylobacillus caricis TaxID=1971611 RepID=UPI001CFF95C0|nr:PEP-CTERM sorting domain-containing protein [Methylobacillus caricis]MCB5187765.1 PEP-CTERM sorting domain-containing protein [Methylobacillus caricis]